MARVSPYFDLTCSSTTGWKGYVNYTLTDDPANNRTKVDAELWAYKNDGYKSSGEAKKFVPKITIDGITYGDYDDRYDQESTTHYKHLEVSDVYVYHNSDGEKTLNISGQVTKEADSYGGELDGKNIFGSTTITLTDYKTSYTVTYNANGGSGTTSSQTVAAGSAVTLRSNNFTAPTSKVWTLTLDGNGGNDGSPTFKGNYFNKWRAGSTSGTAYSEGDSYTPSKDTIMYAWWGTSYIWGATTRDSIINEGYTVTFDANGGTCNTTSSTSIITTSYEFLGWGDLASNPTSTFKSNATYNQTSNYTAYAIWSPTTTNGSITLPTPTRDGYEFLGWSTNEFDTNGVTGEYTPDREGIKLYAIWKRTGNVYICDNTGGSNPYQVLIYDDSGWNQYIPYIYTESGWEIYSG